MMRSILGFVCVVSMVAGSLRAAPAIDWVTVGDPDKAADTDPIGYGAVSYTYQIMKYEFTSQQSVDFLNAVDPQGSNPNGIYYFIAGIDDRGGWMLRRREQSRSASVQPLSRFSPSASLHQGTHT